MPDALSYLSALEQGDGQCENGRRIAQGIRGSYHDIFYRDLAALVNCVANPENLQVRHQISAYFCPQLSLGKSAKGIIAYKTQ